MGDSPACAIATRRSNGDYAANAAFHTVPQTTPNVRGWAWRWLTQLAKRVTFDNRIGGQSIIDIALEMMVFVQ
jgi:hypothetical protein